MKEIMNTIQFFTGKYRFLSNFYPASVIWSGWLYPTVEHAYQAAKMASIKDRMNIRRLPTPGQAKRYARNHPMRQDWDGIKLDAMRSLLRQKFDDPQLRTKLIATYPFKLQEGNNWGDTFWGVCDGKGDNHLGKILMLVRKELRKKGQ